MWVKRLVLALCALGCASGEAVVPAGETMARVSMPMPQRVLVFDFDVSEGVTKDEAKQLAAAVVSGLAEIPIPGQHVMSSVPLPGPALAVVGGFDSLDTGLRDHLRAFVQLQTLVAGFFEPVRRFETEASGPGRIEHTAREIVREVALFYAAQGWLDPGRVPQ
jgi:hypothetical protein